MVDQCSTAFHYEIRIDGAADKMGVLVPIDDEIMKIASIDNIRSQSDALIPMAVEVRLKKDKPEAVGRSWEVASCKVLNCADYAGMGGQS